MFCFMLFIFSLIILKNIQGDPCNLREGIYEDLDVFENCLKSISNYDFIIRDEYGIKYKILGGILKKGYSKEQLSNWKGLKNKTLNIIEEVFNVTLFNSDDSYDYYKNIRNITRNLRNGNCNFFPPYGTVFRILFPFGFEIRGKGEEENLMIVTHSQKGVTNFYLKRIGGKDLRNKRVRRMWMDDVEEIEGEDGRQTLKRWRDENIKRNSFFGELDGKEEEGKDKEGEEKEREYIEIKLFSSRSLRWFDIPKGEVKMECEDEEGKIENETVPFFGHLEEDINSSYLYPISNPLSNDPFDDDGEELLHKYKECVDDFYNINRVCDSYDNGLSKCDSYYFSLLRQYKRDWNGPPKRIDIKEFRKKLELLSRDKSESVTLWF